MLSRFQGKHEDADALMLRAIDITENSFGSDHPALALRLYSRAMLLNEQVRVKRIVGGMSLGSHAPVAVVLRRQPLRYTNLLLGADGVVVTDTHPLL